MSFEHMQTNELLANKLMIRSEIYEFVRICEFVNLKIRKIAVVNAD